MADTPRLDELRRRLADAGAPPDYVRRLAYELEQHLEDSVRALLLAGEAESDALRIAKERLGPAETIAEQAARASRAGRWLARLPAPTLIAVPFLLVPLCWALLLFLTVGFGALLVEAWGIDPRSAAASLYLRTIHLLAQYAVPFFLAAAIYRAARSNWMKVRWAAGAAAATLVTGSMTALALRFPMSAGDDGAIVAGLSMTPDFNRLAVLSTGLLVYQLIRRTRACGPMPAVR